MMNKPYLFLLTFICAGGCATLTKTQVVAVNQFAEAGKNFSHYPAAIISELSEVRVKRGVYAANSIDNPRLHLEELNNIYAAGRSSREIAQKVDLSVKIIDKYARALLLLSADKHVTSLQQQTRSFGISLDSLTGRYNTLPGVQHVPMGIGTAVAQLIALGGRQYVRIRQAKEVKRFVLQADTLVAVMTANLLEFLQSSNITDLISIEETGINDNYLSYLRQVKTVYTSVSNDSAMVASNTRPGIDNDAAYLQLKTAIDAIKDLQQQTIQATKEMRKAHGTLVETIRQKITLQSAIGEIMALHEEVGNIQLTIDKIERSKK